MFVLGMQRLTLIMKQQNVLFPLKEGDGKGAGYEYHGHLCNNPIISL